jgi:hypothetical protein
MILFVMQLAPGGPEAVVIGGEFSAEAPGTSAGPPSTSATS